MLPAVPPRAALSKLTSENIAARERLSDQLRGAQELADAAQRQRQSEAELAAAIGQAQARRERIPREQLEELRGLNERLGASVEILGHLVEQGEGQTRASRRVILQNWAIVGLAFLTLIATTFLVGRTAGWW